MSKTFAVAPATHTVRDRAIQVLAFCVYGALWVAFTAALVVAPARLDEVWAWLASQVLPVQLLLWLLFLPVTAGLWVWETTWPLVLRAAVVLGLAGWTVYMFAPRWLLPRRSAR